MTSPLRKRHQTTPTNTSAETALSRSTGVGPRARVAAAYRSVDKATRSIDDSKEQTLWLPAGWLAVVLLLTAAAPSLGAEASSDGWRARGTAAKTKQTGIQAHWAQPSAEAVGSPRGRASKRFDRSASADGWASIQGRSNATIRQVAFEDDIAGPALRTAGRIHTDRFMDGEYRVAQQDAGEAFGDSLRESFERPFGVPQNDRPTPDADTADSLFDEPAEEPYQEPAAEPDLGEPSFDDDNMEREPRRSIFDDEPTGQDFDPPTDFDRRDDAEEIAPGDIADDLAADYDDDAADEAKARQEAFKNCSEELADLKASRLSMIDLNIAVSGSEGEDFPYHCSLEDGTVFAPRCWGEITYMWKASGLCHKPLYFEDEALERYGHSWGPFVQPLMSGAHFFGTVPILPYKMGLKTPNECVYALGHYRPGNCAPYLIDPIPFTWRAAIFQAGGAVGVAAFLP